MTTVLVLGGARSGKSRYAQSRAEETGLEPVFIATAQAYDEEMALRIARHRADRCARWSTVEAPLDVPEAIGRQAAPERVVLVDCLTLWLSNLLLAQADIEQARRDLGRAVAEARGTVILVSNEVGWGIVPDNALARRFRDEAGLLHQALAGAVDEVRLVVAGRSLVLS